MANIDVMIIGCGKLGSAIAKDLSNKKKNVLVIDKNPDCANNLENYSGYIEIGDGTDTTLLEKYDISHISTVIITTDNDNLNLFLTDLCKKIYNVENVFCRLADSRKQSICSDLDVNFISPFELSMGDFATKYEKSVEL